MFLLWGLQATGAPFVNLDFEQGYTGQASPNVIHGWTTGNVLPENSGICFEGCGALVGPGAAMAGNYSLYLIDSAAISGGISYARQQGEIPAGTQTLRMETRGWRFVGIAGGGFAGGGAATADEGLVTTIGSHDIKLFRVGQTDEGFDVIVGEVSQFAGQEVELDLRPRGERLVSHYDNFEFATVWGEIDNLEFSPLPLLAGDFNGDLVVDAADYAFARDRIGEAITLPGELLTPGEVTLEDLQTWRDNYGQSLLLSPVSASTAPEPASILLIGAWVVVASSSSCRCWQQAS